MPVFTVNRKITTTTLVVNYNRFVFFCRSTAVLSIVFTWLKGSMYISIRYLLREQLPMRCNESQVTAYRSHHPSNF